MSAVDGPLSRIASLTSLNIAGGSAAAPARPELHRGISDQLADSLLGTDAVVGAEREAPWDRDGQQGSEDDEPLTRGRSSASAVGSSQTNRERFAENQRIAAARILAVSMPLLCCLCLFMLAMLVVGFVMYVKGWSILSNFNKPCDQPLKWWLLVMLLFPIMHCQCSDWMRRKVQLFYTPCLFLPGAWFVHSCKTCSETAPELYQFCRSILAYMICAWGLLMFMYFGLVSLLFWLRSNNLLYLRPGPAMAAKPGLIKDIETVEYSPKLFHAATDNGDDAQPPECSICQEDFAPNGAEQARVIKRTPCGHLFHEDCLGSWLGGFAKTCPLCRTDLEQALAEEAGASQA